MHKTHTSINLCKIIDHRKLKSPSQGRRVTILQMRLRKGWRTAPLSASVLVRSGRRRGVWLACRLKVHEILTNLGHSHMNCSFLHGWTGESSSKTRPGHPAAGLFLSGHVHSHVRDSAVLAASERCWRTARGPPSSTSPLSGAMAASAGVLLSWPEAKRPRWSAAVSV